MKHNYYGFIRPTCTKDLIDIEIDKYTAESISMIPYKHPDYPNGLTTKHIGSYIWFNTKGEAKKVLTNLLQKEADYYLERIKEIEKS